MHVDGAQSGLRRELGTELIERVRLATQGRSLLSERREDPLDLRLGNGELGLHDGAPLLESVGIRLDQDFYVHQIEADFDVGVRVGDEIQLVAFLDTGRLHCSETTPRPRRSCLRTSAIPNAE